MTTQAMPSQAQLEAILSSLREVPYQAAETALAVRGCVRRCDCCHMSRWQLVQVSSRSP